MMMMMKISVLQLVLLTLLVTPPPSFFKSSFFCMSSSVNDVVSLQLTNDDILALIVFKSDLHDPSSHLSSWNEDDSSPCSWDHIQCHPSTSHVSTISLDGLRLSGNIAAATKALRNLLYLRILSLSRNNFTGTISPEFALFPSLRSLNLSHNALSGNIPASLLFNSTTIRSLDLSHNSVSGQLLDVSCGGWNTSASSLRFLSVAGNFLDGNFPAMALQRCAAAASLTGLNLSGNLFSGDLDFSTGIWKLTRLRTLDLSDNAFSGEVPRGVSAVHFLEELRLQGNRFSGPLPADIGLCLHLKALDFGDNLFAGALPNSLRRLAYLEFLRLSNNMFVGEFPNWITNTSSGLKYVDFSGNGFTGQLPPSMGASLNSLKFLSVSDNKLTGDIPASLVYCAELSVFRLRGNNLNSSIPNGLFDLGLEELDLSDNELTGQIPSGSSRLFESLCTLDLSHNMLTGTIPAELGLFSNLRYLNLSCNNLKSRMPPELGFLQNLTVLDLRNITLYGSIPWDICDSGSLSVLQLDGNSLTGPIPEEIGNCSSLYLLSLSHNNINGSIPNTISMLNKLRILRLEFNKLSADIPQDLGKLQSLLAVNVSYNRLIGMLPAGGIFQTLDQTSLEGNLGLCSPMLKGPCKMNVPKPLVIDPNEGSQNNNNNNNSGNEPSNNKPNKFQRHRFFSISAIIAISAATVIALGVMFVSLLNASARMQPAFIDNALESIRLSSSSRSSAMMTGKLVLFDSESSSLLSSRDWMSPEISLLDKAAEIGRGVFGTVYKVPMGGGGERETLAIKRLVSSNIIQHPVDFDREVRILGKARHPNLIALRGYQWTPQMQLLVSDYAPNGSLQSKLHERPLSMPPLSWANRFKILDGTAKGLAYLHHSFIPPIVHYGIKPSNILLDEHYNPKISDFGLVRLIMKKQKQEVTRTTTTSTRPQSAAMVGYAAPELECQSLLRVNEKCDVYGFGVIVLELVTGRRPVEYGGEEEDSVAVTLLCNHVRVMVEEGNVLECVDMSIGNYPEEEVLPILKLALVCTSQVPSSRPSMAEVVQILQVIKTPL